MTDTTNTVATPASVDSLRYSVIITLPEPEPGLPEDFERVRRVGPYFYKSVAESAAGSFQMMLHSSAPEGTQVEVGDYDPALPHLDPDVPTDDYGLAEAIRTEPDGPGGDWSFPDLYARLRAQSGDRASKLWTDACNLSDDWAEEEQAERQATAELEARLAPLRERINRAAKQRAGWYTAPATDAATWLLYDMLAAAEPRGATLADFDAVVDLPGGCLDVAAATLTSRSDKLTEDRARALLSTLELALGERGVKVRRIAFAVQIIDDRAPTRGGAPLSVMLRANPAWNLVYNTMGGSPVADIVAPFTEVGALAIVDMLVELVDGTRPNPLNR